MRRKLPAKPNVELKMIAEGSGGLFDPPLEIFSLGHVNGLNNRLNEFDNYQNTHCIDHFAYLSLMRAENAVHETLIESINKSRKAKSVMTQ